MTTGQHERRALTYDAMLNNPLICWNYGLRPFVTLLRDIHLAVATGEFVGEATASGSSYARTPGA